MECMSSSIRSESSKASSNESKPMGPRNPSIQTDQSESPPSTQSSSPKSKFHVESLTRKSSENCELIMPIAPLPPWIHRGIPMPGRWKMSNSKKLAMAKEEFSQSMSGKWWMVCSMVIWMALIWYHCSGLYSVYYT